MINPILVTALLMSLVGCGDSGNFGTKALTAKTPREEIEVQDASGSIPRLERTNTIVGIDANSNGVRDDVEAFINSNYTITAQRAAAMQYAKGMQAALSVDTKNIIQVKEVKKRLSSATSCIYAKFAVTTGAKHPAEVNAELRELTTNTKQRLLAYLAYSKALDGSSWAAPEGNSCE